LFCRHVAFEVSPRITTDLATYEMLHEAGVPAATVEEWVGHDSTEVHQTYIKIGRESLMKASSSLPAI
jgi:hypothetical protein